MNKRRILFFLSILFFTLPFCAKAAILELHGYAWSSNIGWISFNSKDSGGASPGTYAVKFDTVSGYLSGHAWSSNIGWISFNRTETGAPPKDAACDGTECLARVRSVLNIGAADENVFGWARALSAMSGGGDWDGWIRFDHHNANEVKLDSRTTTEPWVLHGYAWGGETVGWISFDHGGRVRVYLDSCDCTNWTPSACGADTHCSTGQKRNERICTGIVSPCAIEVTDCYSHTDCWHNECNSDNKCLLTQGDYPDTCNTDDDCCSCTTSWSECGEEGCDITQKRQLLTCTPTGCLPTLGVCQDRPECYHSVCNDVYPYECLRLPGPGVNECTDDNQCRHKECNDSVQCVYVPGPGSNTCFFDSQCCICTPWTWSECGYKHCAPDRKMRVRECLNDCSIEEIPSCVPTTSCYHTECNEDLLCEVILGPAGDGIANQCGDPASPDDNMCKPIIWEWWEIIARQFGG
jgi:hypothetical protein